jgi:hypothetical protein
MKDNLIFCTKYSVKYIDYIFISNCNKYLLLIFGINKANLYRSKLLFSFELNSTDSNNRDIFQDKNFKIDQNITFQKLLQKKKMKYHIVLCILNIFT